jgi:signal transduction histidine kinase
MSIRTRAGEEEEELSFRPRPIAATRPAPGGAHSVQFYADDGLLLDGLARFVGAALVVGDAAIVIATAAHRQGLARRLAARGLDLDRAAAGGRYVALDAAETLATFMVDDWPDAERFAARIGGVVRQATSAASSDAPRVVAFGEMVALLWAAGAPEAALELERLWNELARTHAFDLHCAYPISLFPRASDADPIARVCAAHTHVTPAEDYTALPDEGERLRAVALLQQKARALEAEVAERRLAQAALEAEVAERRLAQAALERRDAELRAAAAARDEFLSIAAHELKTPITGLRGYAQLLIRELARGRELVPERLERGLDAINRQSLRLTQLVERLLDIGLVEAGQLRLAPVAVDLAALVREVVARQPAGLGLRLVFEGPERLSATGDPARLAQVVAGLLDNAARFSPEGGTVRVELGQLADGSAQLTVTDEGVGIPTDQLEAIFDRFYKAPEHEHLAGIGLGLHVAREIVRLHGGSIRAEQPAHRGTRLLVTLPPSGDGATG